jgi:pimeloyl-ACP methyl ester carboxylesterase
MPQQSQTGSSVSWKDAPAKWIDVDGTKFAYRQLGPDTGVPVIFLNHLAGELDRWDPRVVDGIAEKCPVIAFDNRGIGASEGSTPNSVAAMARDAVAFIRALGLEQVDLLGFSLGGFISQVIAQEEPQLVRKMILAGTGPAGGTGIDNVTSITIRDMIKGALTLKHPEYYLFFTRTPNGRRAAREFLKRLKERTEDRDKSISLVAFAAQLKAIHAWGRQAPADLSRIHHPVLVANGDQDKMVPSSNSVDLAHRLPNAELVLYDDAGHGGIFQYHEQFVTKALGFLDG